MQMSVENLFRVRNRCIILVLVKLNENKKFKLSFLQKTPKGVKGNPKALNL